VTVPPFLIGDHVVLRALAEEDCSGPYLNWFNDAEVCRHNSHHLFPYRYEDALSYVRKIRDSPLDLVLAIVEKIDNRHVGNVALQNIDYVNRSSEFAIVIGEKDCWGKGYSKEAGRLMLDHAFLSLNLYRVYCGTSRENVPMQRLALFLGMKKEGCRRQALFKQNRRCDVLDYGVLEPEYTRLFHAPARKRKVGSAR